MIAILLPGLIGILFIYLGVITLNGSYKKWYLGPRIFPPQALVYASIPFGIAGIELSAVGLLVSQLGPDTAGWIVGFLVVPTTLLGFVLAIWRPKWIKPKWVYWLEENYSDNIYTLIADARKNPKAWEARIATQQGLEEWAKEIASKPGPRRRF